MTELVSRPWRCIWGIHKWSIWSKPVRGVRQTLNWKPEPVDVQERTCLKCGRAELRIAQ